MKLLIYSYYPLEDQQVLGGAESFMAGLLPRLAEHVGSITVACPPTRCPQANLPSNVTVSDDLIAIGKEEANATELQHDLRVLHRLAQSADVVVTVDSSFPAATDMPVILCINNFSYGRETRSVYSLNWDAIIVPSDYVRNCIEWYFGPSAWHGPRRPVYAVPPGIDPVAPAAPAALAALHRDLAIPPDVRLLAFPHRPDPGKGFDVALEALALLRQKDERFRLMVPTPSASAYPDPHGYMRTRIDLAGRLGLTEFVYFHPWIDRSAMPSYLALAEWTLFPTTLPEAFGLSVAESIRADVPVAATPTGAVLEVLPPGHGVGFVEFGDAKALAETVLQGSDADQVSRGRRRLLVRYSWDQCIARWLSIVRGTTVNRPRFLLTASEDGPGAPWRRTLPSGRVWHDYLARYVDREEAAGALSAARGLGCPLD
jgi:glycosyltransferase involved in cell wall biosynthesis